MRGPSVARDRCAHDDSGTSMPGCVPTPAMAMSTRRCAGFEAGADGAPFGGRSSAARADAYCATLSRSGRPAGHPNGATSSRAARANRRSRLGAWIAGPRGCNGFFVESRAAELHPHMPQKRAAPGSHRTGSATRRTEMMDRLWPRRCAAPAKTRRIHSLGVGGRTDFCDAEHSPARPRQEGCQRKRM